MVTMSVLSVWPLLLTTMTSLTQAASSYAEAMNVRRPSIQPCRQSCGLHAICTTRGQCVCPPHLPQGDPGFYCYASSRSGCFAFGDPRLRGFNSEESRIKFPCRVTLAQFDTIARGGDDQAQGIEQDNLGYFSERDPSSSRCRFVVQSTTRMSPGGEYYTQSVDVKVVINMKGSAHSLWTHLEAGNVYYNIDGGPNVYLGPRDCNPVDVGTGRVSICHHVDQGLWQVSSPDCGHSDVIFRHWDTDRERQLRVVGVGVITEQKTTDFSDRESKYPYCLCSTPYSSKRHYLDFYHSRGLTTRYGSFMYAFLLHPPREEQPDEECQKLTSIFADCPGDRHVGAVNACAPILLDFALCATGNGESPLQAFHYCMTGYCSSGGEKELCRRAQEMIRGAVCPDTPELGC